MTNSRDYEESEAMRHYYREELHRLPRGIYYPIAQWIAEECRYQGMTRDEFAYHCLESLKVDRKDTGVTCPLCGAYFEFGTQQGIDASQVHYCEVTA